MNLLEQLQQLPKPPNDFQFTQCHYLGTHVHHIKSKDVDLNDIKPLDMQTVKTEHALQFPMAIWDWYDETFSTYNHYCPQQDVVSWSIDNYGIWEPYETAIVLDLLSEDPTGPVLDIGAQIGWYSILASLKGYEVYAIESDLENIDMIKRNNELNDIEIQTIHGVVDGMVHLQPEYFHFVKVDIEGMEWSAVNMLAESFVKQRIKYALLEISPSMNDGYPDLVEQIIRYGYRAFQVPHKGWDHMFEFSRYPLEILLSNCELPEDNREQYVAGLDQEDVLFVRES